MKYQLINKTNPSFSAVEQILVNRGIKYEDIDHYLKTTDDDILDPETIDFLTSGVKLLVKHIGNKSKIFIQIDSDCDGYVSGSALINYLRRIFPEYSEHFIEYRLHEGKEHGVIVDTVPEDCKLVIIPDAGSNQLEEHKALVEKGIDVLVIDHHEAEERSPYATVINNQLCDYPTKSLSGVGMVYKFCCFIDKIMGVNYADDYLDLVALGLVADMVSLRDFETKHLIQKGISNIRNPYFKGMVEKNSFSLGGNVTPMGVAFYIAPYINATIRMGTKEEKETLFRSMLDLDAYKQIPSTKRGSKGQLETRVEQAIRNSVNVKNRQTKLRDEGLQKIESIIEEYNLLDNKILLIRLEDEIINKNLTGLIANQLMSKYSRPVLLLHKVEKDGKVSWQGSGRGYDKSDFNYLKDFLNNSGLVEYAEGHQNAHGLGIEHDNLKSFIDYSNIELEEYSFTSSYLVDFIFDVKGFSAKDIIEIAGLESLWGKDIDESIVAIENIKVTKSNITLMSPDKNPTIKITLPNGVALIKFKSSGEEYMSLISEGYVQINIVGTCRINEWNGIITPQILVKEYEIVEVAEYYF